MVFDDFVLDDAHTRFCNGLLGQGDAGVVSRFGRLAKNFVGLGL